jgi:hypothetical protein
MSAQFRYEARAASGRIERGVLAAASREEALLRLNRRSLTPLALKPESASAGAQRLSDKAARDLARTLAQLLRSGLPFAQALRFASEELAPAPASAAARMREKTPGFRRGQAARYGWMDRRGVARVVPIHRPDQMDVDDGVTGAELRGMRARSTPITQYRERGRY